MFRRLGHAYELYPIIALCGAWALLFVYIVYFSFEKIEIWIDRSEQTLVVLQSRPSQLFTGQELPPWDWERVRNKYVCSCRSWLGLQLRL